MFFSIIFLDIIIAILFIKYFDLKEEFAIYKYDVNRLNCIVDDLKCSSPCQKCILDSDLKKEV